MSAPCTIMERYIKTNTLFDLNNEEFFCVKNWKERNRETTTKIIIKLPDKLLFDDANIEFLDSDANSNHHDLIRSIQCHHENGV